MVRDFVIDCHMHIYPSKALGLEEKEKYEVWEYGRKPNVQLSRFSGDIDDALQAIRESGTSKAVIMSHLLVTILNLRLNFETPKRLSGPREDAGVEAKIAQMLHDSNVSICKLARNHSELVPFVIIDPHTMTSDALEAELRELVTTHCARGVKLHPVLQQFFPNDRRMWPIYRACSELGVPILSHSGATRGPEQYAEPRAFIEVLQQFPRLTLILAHLGGAAWQQTLAVAREYQNTYFDCSEIIEWATAPFAPTLHELAQLIKGIGPERVIMGTDFPWYDLDRTIGQVKSLPILSEEEKQGILGANASQILGI